MESDFKSNSKPNEIDLFRPNTASSPVQSLRIPHQTPDEVRIAINSIENNEFDKSSVERLASERKLAEKIESSHKTNAKLNISQPVIVKVPVDPDQKYYRLGLLVQCLIILKILLLSVCLFRIQLLGLAIIADFFGELAVCHMKKKAMKIYMIILCGSFAAKIFGISNLVQNSKDSEYFNLLFGVLVSVEVIEGIQGILLCFFAYYLFQMSENKIDELYNKNCICCRSKTIYKDHS